MAWAPLLDGDLAASAIAAVRELAPVAERASAWERTIFWAYVSDHTGEPFAFAAYDAALGDLVGELDGDAASPALHGGLAGIGWTLAHVLDADAEDLLAAVDAALLDVLA